MEKKTLFPFIESQLSFAGASKIEPTGKLGQYRFVYKDNVYILNHRHRNLSSTADFTVHFTPEEFEFLKSTVDDHDTPCIALSLFYKNQDTDCVELLLSIISTSRIEEQLANPYNHGFIIGKVTGNFVIRFNNNSCRDMICSSSDILSLRYFFPQDVEDI